MFLTEDEALMG